MKNIRKNNGFAGIDISISIIIILIFIPTIFGIVYNIQKTNASVKRKSTAVGIATNVLEIIKSEDYEDVVVDSEKLNYDLSNKYEQSTYKNEDKEEIGYNYIYYKTTDQNDKHYQIQIGIKNFYPSEDETEDLIKQIKVRVFYPYGNNVKDINIRMVKQNV